jgi:hypothetical protein
MAACSSRQVRYAIHQRFRTAAERVVHEFPAKASDEAGVVEIVLITISIIHRQASTGAVLERSSFRHFF